MTSPERIDLVLRATIADPANPVTWSVDGRHPTPDELDGLVSLTSEDWEAALDLLRLDKELNGRELAQLLRECADEAQSFLDRLPG